MPINKTRHRNDSNFHFDNVLVVSVNECKIKLAYPQKWGILQFLTSVGNVNFIVVSSRIAGSNMIFWMSWSNC